MEKCYTCTNKDFLTEPEILNAFLKGFSANDRIQLASLCLMYNSFDRYPDIENSLKRNKDKVFKFIDKQLEVIKKSLEQSYIEAMKK